MNAESQLASTSQSFNSGARADETTPESGSHDARWAGFRPMLLSLGTHTVLLGAVVFALYPVMWVMSLAFGTDNPAPKVLPLPDSWSLQNFRILFGGDGSWLFLRQLLNSLFVAAATAVVALLVATPGAYALSRFEFVGRKQALGTLLATQMFPGVAAAIPLYLTLDAVGLIDTLGGLILVYATSAVPFAVFQLRAAFDSVPRELEQAAMVDGATQFRAFVLIVLPVVRPALAVTGLFAFMAAWNEFILAATFLSREEAFTLPIVLQRYVGEYDSQWGPFAAGALIVSFPVVLLFYWLQKHLIAGLTSGGVKG